MLDKAGRLHIVGVRHHELFVLRRRDDLFAELAGTQRTIDQRHRHGLALALPERQAITACETWRLRRRSLELVDHLAFGQCDFAERHRKTYVLREELDFDLPETDFARERVVAAVTALRRITQRKQKAFIGTREILEPQITIGRKAQRFPREIADGL